METFYILKVSIVYFSINYKILNFSYIKRNRTNIKKLSIILLILAE